MLAALSVVPITHGVFIVIMYERYEIYMPLSTSICEIRVIGIYQSL